MGKMKHAQVLCQRRNQRMSTATTVTWQHTHTHTRIDIDVYYTLTQSLNYGNPSLSLARTDSISLSFTKHIRFRCSLC